MKKKNNKEDIEVVGSKIWLPFILKTIFYLVVLLGLIYLYQYSQVGGGSFIYNQF